MLPEQRMLSQVAEDRWTYVTLECRSPLQRGHLCCLGIRPERKHRSFGSDMNFKVTPGQNKKRHKVLLGLYTTGVDLKVGPTEKSGKKRWGPPKILIPAPYLCIQPSKPETRKTIVFAASGIIL